MKTKQKTNTRTQKLKLLLKNPWAYLGGSLILLVIVLAWSYLSFLNVVNEQTVAYAAAKNNLQELKVTLEEVDPSSPWEFDAYCDYVNLGFGGRGQRSCQAHLVLDKVFSNPEEMLQRYVAALEDRKDLIEKKANRIGTNHLPIKSSNFLPITTTLKCLTRVPDAAAAQGYTAIINSIFRSSVVAMQRENTTPAKTNYLNSVTAAPGTARILETAGSI